MKSLSIPTLLTVGSLATAAYTAATPKHHTSSSDDTDDHPIPLIVWHGLGDSYDGEGIKRLGEVAEELNPGTFVYTIKVGADPNADRSATFFGNVTTQLEEVCAELAAHPILSTAPAVDAIGFSQGGQFLRGYVERCNNPPVRSLVTYGSQHNGIVEFRACGDGDFLCKGAMALLRFNTWSGFVQNRLVPAQYYRDPQPEQYEKYLESSNFLADINNERELKNVRYGKNLASLANFVMVMFEDDTTVIPKETAWFEEVNGTESLPLRARAIYKEDWIGLRELDRKGGLRFRQIPGEHMQISDKTLNKTIQEFFGPFKKTFEAEKTVEDVPVFEEL
ncbi:palmitoyl protein thioesterase [Colletotrichum scovillei]|uniref:Palmitoyl-protein thioesterase 1 n=1 Tax=Colletotrichum scovillei TaxID=1209932 RepID=A0A9P7U5Q7_9PEZI|nr:palmitoyl protein thioesterase [Colletotrichum scovillei]KAF4778163.1 palmitoyl protein thioesterase [Colletotrichum scovillei]KAG7038511.1 palmitoyl protein thioesterase [Colletotrichum scovillei]KAG7040690.1 palmitoyl protein thioesterase [Colletotrichum scovillei]KAG7060734.1 palmitoyl protein thioesterase [Colletotrichum scovillei]